MRREFSSFVKQSLKIGVIRVIPYGKDPMKCPYYAQCFAERIARENDFAQLVLPLLAPIAADLVREQREALDAPERPSLGCLPRGDEGCARG